MERSQFTFYESFFRSISRIKNKAARCDAYDAICRYALTGEEPDLDNMADIAAIAFEGAKPNLDASRRKAENGKKGGDNKPTESKPEANGKQTESKNKNKDKNKNKKKNKDKCLNGDFDAFWEAYPRKEGKQKAMAAFEKVDVGLDVILAAIERHKKSTQWTKNGGEFIPHAATWLNGRRWEDEVGNYEAVPKGANGLGEAEMDAIRRIMGG